MFIKPKSNLSEKLPLTDNAQAYFIDKDFQEPFTDAQPGIIQQLLNEIYRVKELIIHYNSSSDNSNVPIFSELVTEAQNSLVNYDVVLINKYYELL